MSCSTPITYVTSAIALADQLVKQMDYANRSSLKQLAAGIEVELVKVKNEMIKLQTENEALKAGKQ
jgi:hypothetical protein